MPCVKCDALLGTQNLPATLPSQMIITGGDLNKFGAETVDLTIEEVMETIAEANRRGFAVVNV